MNKLLPVDFQKRNQFVNHTKDPFSVKRVNTFVNLSREGVLDGYHALVWSKCELPNEVVFLQISDRGIKQINEVELYYFINLSVVKADNNYLNLDHFCFMKNLRSLSLMQNQIEILPNLQNCLLNLEELDLSFNMIKDLKPVSYLVNLKKLNIAGNNIKKLNFGYKQIQKLQELDLSFNNLSEQSDFQLWKKLSKFSNLKVLKLNSNNFQTIQEPPNTMQKFKLDYLDLSSNNFKDEVDLICLSTMTALKKLNLSFNKNLFIIKNFVEVLIQKFNTQIVTQDDYDLTKQKAIAQFKDIKVTSIKKQINFQEFFINKKEIFDNIFEQKQKTQPIKQQKKTIKPTMFLTSINCAKQQNQKQPSVRNLTTQDAQMIAQILLKDHLPQKLRNLNFAFNELNKFL